MKEIIPVLYDDLTLHEEGRKETADVSEYLALGSRRVELDLTDAHHGELSALLSRYLDAGHPVDREPPRRREFDPDKVEYNKGLRNFARHNGLPYKTASGSIYYSPRLKESYDLFLGDHPWREYYDNWRPRRGRPLAVSDDDTAEGDLV